MKRNTVAAMLLLSLLGVGCVSTQALRLGNTPTLPAVPKEKIVVYRSADQVPGKYVEMALLTSTGSANYTTEGGMFESMKKKAGEIGANAIILDATSEPSAGAKVAAAFLGVGGADRKGKAIAIYIYPLGEEPKK